MLDAFVFRDHLRAEQQEHGGDLEAQEHHDGGGEGAVHVAHARKRREVPQQGVARGLQVILDDPESGFDPQAVSPKGAVGLMQIMPATAQRYGVNAAPEEPAAP